MIPLICQFSISFPICWCLKMMPFHYIIECEARAIVSMRELFVSGFLRFHLPVQCETEHQTVKNSLCQGAGQQFRHWTQNLSNDGHTHQILALRNVGCGQANCMSNTTSFKGFWLPFRVTLSITLSFSRAQRSHVVNISERSICVWNCDVEEAKRAAMFTFGDRYDASILNFEPIAPSMAHPTCMPKLS